MSLNQKYFELFKSDSNSAKFHKDSNILIVDGMNTFIRTFMANPSLSENGEHIGGVVGFLKSIGYTCRELNPTRVIVVFDGMGGSAKRKKLLPEYKANRSSNRLHVNRMYGASEEEERESMKRQLILSAELLQLLPVTIMMYDNVEADDIMAYIATTLAPERSVIVSADKDFLQLVDDDTYVWSPTKKILYTKEIVRKEFEMPACNYLMFRVLNGDKSDNIPGLPGAGPKTILKRFPILQEDKEVTIEDLVKYAEEHRGKIKLYDTVLENIDLLERNYSLMQLKDVDIRGTTKLKAKNKFEEPINKTNSQEFKKRILLEKMTRAFAFPDDWLRDNFYTINIHADGE